MAAKKTAKKTAETTAAKPAPAAKKAARKTAAKTAAKTAPAAKTAAKSPVARAAPPKVTTEMIARVAYLNYRRRVEQGLPGDSHSDWLEAERQLTSNGL